MECSMREAGSQEFFREGNIVPLTTVYEDFIQRYEESIRKILKYLGFGWTTLKVSTPYFARTADNISEEWHQRFRHELQESWLNRGW